MTILERENLKRKKITIAIVLLLILANLYFIWGSSLKTGTESSKISGSLFAFIKPFFDNVFYEGFMTEHLLRKIGHFSEFCLLGILTNILSYILNGICKIHFVLYPVIFCIAIASIDETIQIFVDGRGPSVKDVIIDTSGAIFGTILILLVIKFINYIFHK